MVHLVPSFAGCRCWVVAPGRFADAGAVSFSGGVAGLDVALAAAGVAGAHRGDRLVDEDRGPVVGERPFAVAGRAGLGGVHAPRVGARVAAFQRGPRRGGIGHAATFRRGFVNTSSTEKLLRAVACRRGEPSGFVLGCGRSDPM